MSTTRSTASSLEPPVETAGAPQPRLPLTGGSSVDATGGLTAGASTLPHRPILFVAHHFVGLRVGRYYMALKGPSNRPYFSERNRIKCRVYPLGHGWRIVVRTNR